MSGHEARRAQSAERGHEAIPHTADVGLRAWAPDLEGLFEEAALGLVTLASDGQAGPPGDRPTTSARVELEARDLAGLAYAWLNELIGLGEVHRARPGRVSDIEVDGPTEPRLSATVELEPYRASDAPPLRQVKAATFHRLEVRPTASGWTLVAYLDV